VAQGGLLLDGAGEAGGGQRCHLWHTHSTHHTSEHQLAVGTFSCDHKRNISEHPQRTKHPAEVAATTHVRGQIYGRQAWAAVQATVRLDLHSTHLA
jgi:hypothetical protein